MVKPTLAATIDRSVFPGVQGGPLEHVIAAKAVGFKLALERASSATTSARTLTNARVLAETLAARALRLVSGGTDNHLILADVTPLGVTGREAEHLLDEIGITVNKNAIPFDPNPPNIASGIRIGTPATTSRGLRRGRDARRSAGSSSRRSAARDEPAAQARSPSEVAAIVDRFPVPGLTEA